MAATEVAWTIAVPHGRVRSAVPMILGERQMAGMRLPCPPISTLQPAAPAGKARLKVVAAKCPFGFGGDVIKEGKKMLRSEAATMEAPTRPAKLGTDPYAPAPSVNPDVLPIGPGNFEYLPFKIPYKMVMGLEPMDPNDWIEIDMFYDEEMALRREILGTRRAVSVALTPGAEDACAEMLELLADFLPKRFPNRFALAGTVLTNKATGERFDLSDQSLDPLDVSARLVQEDLCIMQDVGGDVRFTAGAVLFPQRWQLLEKLGMRMVDIHKPVPRYVAEISKPVDGFMNRLRVGKPFWRANWAVVDDPTLFQPLNEEDIYAAVAGSRVKEHLEPITPQNAGDRLFTRCERETLVRFPRSNAILFTIRTYVKPLRVFAGRPELAAQFVRALDALPPELVRYKTMIGHMGAARAYLEACAAREAAPH